MVWVSGPGAVSGRRPRRERRRRPSLQPLESRTLMAAALGAEPVVTAIKGPAPGTYGAGATLTFRVSYSEPVRATGSPTLPVQIGSTVQEAALAPTSARGFSRTLVFKATVPAGSSDRDGIELGTVGVQDGGVVRLMDGSDGIRGRDGDSAAAALPSTPGLSRVLVDAVGPVVSSYGFQNLPADVVRAGGRITLQVRFDEPVFVKGRPTVPFVIGGQGQALVYSRGSGTNILTFTYRTAVDVDATTVGFAEQQGEAILLPAGSSIRDRRGDLPNFVKDAEGGVLNVNGSKVVVLGTYYQYLRRVGLDELRSILNVESREFGAESSPPASYAYPDYVQPTHEVDLYKVTYNSTIPELGNRPTTATGLVAIPVPTADETAAGGDVARAVVSYQHGTVYGLKSVPSYSFIARPTDSDYLDSYETRLAVAQFAGLGYVVIAADYFGMGDSTEPDAYAVKASEQQACLDMYLRSADLIRGRGVQATNLLLSGWSQGGLTTMAFLQKLEEQGIPVLGASTASAPSDVLAATSAMLFNHRGPTDPVPDAVWLNTIFIIAAFSYENYYSEPGLAINFFDPEYYEGARRVYSREYDHLGFDSSTSDLLVYPTAEGAPLHVPSDLTRLIRPQYFDPSAVGQKDPRYYPFSTLATRLRDAGAYQWIIHTPVQLNYGTDDEAFSPSVALISYEYQRAVNANNPITPLAVDGGNHRGTFLTAVDRQRSWFNQLLGRDPGPKPAGLS